MKKIIAISLLLPSLALAFGEVTINSLSVDGSTVNSSGTVTYEGLLTLLTVQIDGSNVLQRSQTEPVENWGIAQQVSSGSHTLTAILSRQDFDNQRTASRTFTVGGGDSGQPICMRTGECPYFGLRGGVSAGNFLASGDGECPIWFPFGCRK